MNPTIEDIILRLDQDKMSLGIELYDAASSEEILFFETSSGIKLPDDIKAFYSFCNGFESNEDLFRIIPLNEIIGNGKDNYMLLEKDFHIAEYMIYSDMWTMSIDSKDQNQYLIYNKAEKFIRLTNDFSEFLNQFLNGGVFDGLYKWSENIEYKSNH